ncbi:MAG: type II 3-dehydroquinate dehydratase [Christensenellales bacterium]
MKKIMVINGPNLNMLGIREKNIYGDKTYDGLVEFIKSRRGDKAELSFFQSNSEGAIIDCLHGCYFDNYDGVVINPGAYTHYSYAIMDAIKAINLPVVEVHISDVDNREDFRKISVTAAACVAQIKGKGFDGYVEAIDILTEKNND